MIDINVTFFIQCINFLISLFLINILIVGPIRSVLQRRREELEHTHNEIVGMQEEIEKLSITYMTSIEDAEQEGKIQCKDIIEKAKVDSLSRLTQAKEHALTRSLQVEEELEKQASQLSQELTQSVYTLSATIVKRLVQ